MQQEIFLPEEYLNPKWYIFKEQTLGKLHDTSKLKSVLSAVRPTVVEGSFGVLKESYGLKKNKRLKISRTKSYGHYLL